MIRTFALSSSGARGLILYFSLLMRDIAMLIGLTCALRNARSDPIRINPSRNDKV
ncbi:MAG: hypothetical protein WD768_11135 [Phycisphaeraceae bacterium]